MCHDVIPFLSKCHFNRASGISCNARYADANPQLTLTLQMEHLTDAQVLLLAAQFAATPDLTKLRALAAQRQDILTASITCRILLTYLPLDASLDVEDELVLLLKNIQDGYSSFSTLDSPLGSDANFELPNTRDAERSLSSLKLDKITKHFQSEEDGGDNLDVISDFLIAWTHKVDEFNGIESSTSKLVNQFCIQHPALKQWNETYLIPLNRLENEFYPAQSTQLSLHDIEVAHGENGVKLLLQYAEQSGRAENIGRDLQEVVVPWVMGSSQKKRRKMNTLSEEQRLRSPTSWSDINKWLFSLAHTKFPLAAAAVQQWNGPLAEQDPLENLQVGDQAEDPTIAYIRTILAMIHVSSENDDNEQVPTKKALLQRAAHLAQLMPPDFELLLPEIPDPSSLQRSARSDLLENALLRPENQLTRPSTDVVDFLYGILSTQSLLSRFKLESTTKSVISTVLFESEDKQKHELRTLLAQMPRLTRSVVQWTDFRDQILWLHSWSHGTASSHNQPSLTYLGRLSVEYIQLEILDAMLAAKETQSVKEMYILSQPSPLSAPVIEQHVKDAIFNAYDNASNGNRTRGGVKKASEILSSFRSSFIEAADFEQIEYLIKATHSLSFYQLTLQHGVPFQPVSIRVSNDPLSLIGKVLDQNSKAYTKLDDLIGIARNLVRAGLPTPTPQDFAPGEVVPMERRLQDAEHRVTYLAITAALADHDFDTAYSLITSRLTASHNRTTVDASDDTSWRAAYAAGKYRPANSPQDLHKRIASLSQRMDLLSTALTLAPKAEALPEILATWRRCEEEMDSLKSQAVQEERALDAQSDGLLPGAFGPSDRDLDANETKRLLENRRTYNTTGPSYEEEAPMGLFDVARGAANALRKNAFPLRGAAGPGQQGIKVGSARESMEGSMRSNGESERPGSADGQQRVRKRDMLSNAVTGTLVGGMSWVLGAQPPPRGQQGQE